MALALVAAGTLSCASMVADAGSPVTLTDRQLDRVTAQGGPAALVNATATGSGLFTTGTVQTAAITEVGDSPFDGATAVATGQAFGLGTNGAAPGTSSTNVTTFTEAPGNFVINVGWNRTVSGMDSTFQVGVSVSVANLIPGLP
jgi:hypothetical protein